MMRTFVRHCLPGLALIALISAILLATGADRRAAGLPRVALFQYASRPVLDDAMRGVEKGLAECGFVDGRTIRITRYNAEGDMPTAQNISRLIAGGSFEMALTGGTLCLQSLAAANDGRVLHVFGTVTDPYGSGVGIDAADHRRHPPHLVGVGSFQPVRATFLLARQCNPGLKRIGTVYCPAEACSQACLAAGKTVAAELGITIDEAQVHNATDIMEASAALAARGVEAIFIGGDNLVEGASGAVIAAANNARIPVVAYAAEHAAVGALLGVGVDYFDMGVAQGTLAAGILAKTIDPATYSIENFGASEHAVSLDPLEFVDRSRWSLPDAVRAGAKAVYRKGKKL